MYVNVLVQELTFGMTPGREADLAVFERAMIAHERLVLMTAYRLLGRMEDAQDAAQEVFLRLFRHFDRVADIQDLRPWLYRVTVNVCHDEFRRRRPSVELDPARAAAGPDPEAALGMAERKRLVEHGLRTLTEKERTAVVLRDIEGLSTKEVAEVLGSTEGTVRSHLFSARLKLKKFTDRLTRRRS